MEPSHPPPSHHAPNQSLQFSPEDMITRSEQELTNPNQGYPFDPSLQHHSAHTGNIYVHEQSTTLRQGTNYDPPTMRPTFNQHHSFDGRDGQGFERGNAEQMVDDTGTTDGRKKKGSSSSIANDIELRKLFRENQHRSLKDVAAQVLANERGPRSEKNKQIFAMLW